MKAIHFPKKFLHLIGKEYSPYCLICGIIEDNNHIIKVCKKYDNIRAKYSNSLEQILNNNKDDELTEICAFLNEIDYICYNNSFGYMDGSTSGP